MWLRRRRKDSTSILSWGSNGTLDDATCSPPSSSPPPPREQEIITRDTPFLPPFAASDDDGGATFRTTKRLTLNRKFTTFQNRKNIESNGNILLQALRIYYFLSIATLVNSFTLSRSPSTQSSKVRERETTVLLHPIR